MSPLRLGLIYLLPAVIFVASFHAPEVIFEQLSLIYSLPR